MKYPTYPAYKPSGVDWFGDVPEHWQLGRLRWVAQVYAGGTPDTEREEYWNGEIPWINSGAVNQGHITEPSAYITKGGLLGSSARWVPRGALVMALAGQGKTKATVAQLGIDATCNQSMAAIVPRDLAASRFLYWWLAAQYDAIRNLAGGEIRDGLNLEILGSLLVPTIVPEGPEIADFLDRETSRVDTLIAKKRELIEKLNEKRSALISRVVTRGLPPEAARAAGLDPNPPLKPCGIDWVEEIPAHWEARKIKYLARVASGHTPSRSVEEYWIDCTIPWVSLADSGYLRNHDYIAETTHEINDLGLANSSARLLPPAAVVFSRDATVGLCAITTRPMAVAQHFIAYLCGPKLFPKYLLLCLKAMGQHLSRLSMGSTIPTIGMPDIYSLVCPLPPLAEQRTIAAYLDQETAKIDHLAAKIGEAIGRLQEYRSALVTAAVTGMIDLRGNRAPEV